ncbi:MAG: OsmC family protein [Oligoflexia bacterium]|nr:OsmC family protein [Oligoflexia bacterium]
MKLARVQFGPGKVSQKIQIGSFTLAADVTQAEGGEDTAPSPHDYLGAALGACTSMTLRMYAARKAWPVEDVITEITLNQEDGVSKFERKIRLIGPLNEEQRKRLLEIAEHCPVHKTLKGKIEIQTALEP